MKVAVLSGKGGAGKTFVAVNLAATAQDAVYIDCDVEEPNGRLFLKPEKLAEQIVTTPLPAFDREKCTGCRKCVDFCRFHALVYIKGKPKVFPEVCHACGGCQMVCPAAAITETAVRVGVVEQGDHGKTRVVTGVLDIGEASGVPVIAAALQAGKNEKNTVVIDCPPGSACSVMESVSEADYCVLVAEPTAFGFHNFKMVYELVRLLKKPCGVVINKMDAPYEPLEGFCRENAVPVLARIPYREETARLCAAGTVLSEADDETAAMFRSLWQQIGGVYQ